MSPFHENNLHDLKKWILLDLKNVNASYHVKEYKRAKTEGKIISGQ
jgi:hypothetical protein